MTEEVTSMAATKRTLAARKTKRLGYFGAAFTLSVEEDPEHDGYMLVQLFTDKPNVGQDSLLYTVHLKRRDD